jgi:hypothetical protein
MEELLFAIRNIDRHSTNNTEIDSSKFTEIRKSNQGSIFCIDGGEAMLYESPVLCIAFIRVCGLVYKDNKRIVRTIKEFYIVMEQKNKWSIKTFPANALKNVHEIILDTSMEGPKVLSSVRRIAELEMAMNMGDQKKSQINCILLDGNLESTMPIEKKLIDELSHKNLLIALSKNSSIKTHNGISMTKALFDASQFIHHSWHYPYSDIISFVKLHGNSKFIFRIDASINSKIPVALAILAGNSTDPIFLGYPYALIDADMYARISDEEKKMLQTKIMAKLGKDWNTISKNFNNAHAILDKIRF